MPDAQQIEKNHSSLDEARGYIEKHVQQKLDRGYKIHEIGQQGQPAQKQKPEDKVDDLSADGSDDEPQLKKKLKGNPPPSIVISKPDNLEDEEEKKDPLNNHSIGNADNNQSNQLNIDKREYSVSSRKSSLVSLTDDNLSVASRGSDSHNSGDDDQEQEDIDYQLGNPSSECITVLLAEKWDESIDPKGYMMSEKLDGVRCFWSGTKMYSRNKQFFYPPKFFIKNWPKCQLDGELFTKRSDFQKCVSVVKKQRPIDEGIAFAALSGWRLPRRLSQSAHTHTRAHAHIHTHTHTHAQMQARTHTHATQDNH